ncbi:MAG: trypsin-like peptidase domain-containing protein [Prosthecobacter sp.]
MAKKTTSKATKKAAKAQKPVKIAETLPTSHTRWVPKGDSGLKMPVIKEGFVSKARMPDGLSLSVIPRRVSVRQLSAKSLIEAKANPQLATLHELGINPTLITQPDLYPWCAHVMLDMVAHNGQPKVGSGWLIGRRTIITAGHCIYDGGWMRQILVSPGGPESSFTKRIPGVYSDTTHDWIYGATAAIREAADVGMVRLAEDVTPLTGTLPFSAYTNAQLNAVAPDRLSVAGFPAHSGLFTADAGTLRQYNGSHLIYDIETWKGQSGAPVLHWGSNGQPMVIGIHHWDVGNNLNRAIRITPQAAALLLRWAA